MSSTSDGIPWSARELREFIEHAPYPLLIVQPDGTVIDLNSQALEACGVDRAQAMGASLHELNAAPAVAPPASAAAKAAGEALHVDAEEAVSATVKEDEDPLTGLALPSALQDMLENEARQRERDGGILLGIFIELQGTTAVDQVRAQEHMEEAEEAVLAAMGLRIRACTRTTDLPARVGEKRFLVILPQTHSAEGLRVIDKLEQVFSATPVATAWGEMRCQTLVGLIEFDGDGTDMGSLINEVDAALETRRKRSAAIRTSESSNTPERLLDLLLSGEVLSVVGQPIVRMRDREHASVELLIRSSLSGYELPEDFFRLAREGGRLEELDLKCFDFCAKIAGRQAAGSVIHLNVFPSSLRAQAVERMLDSFDRLAPQQELCVEISQQQIIGAPKYLEESVNALRDVGVHLAIDHMGLGRSSLETAIALEPALVKIHHSCIDGISNNPARRNSLRRFMASLDHLGCQVAAQGVGNQEDVSTLLELGVSFGQGELFAAPLPMT